jgi:hypothetical protein
MATAESGVYYSDDDSGTKRKRRLIDAMLIGGMDSSPVQHWTQALARAVQGAVGGYGANLERQERRAEARTTADALLGFLKQQQQPPVQQTSAAPAGGGQVIDGDFQRVDERAIEPQSTLSAPQVRPQASLAPPRSDGMAVIRTNGGAPFTIAQPHVDRFTAFLNDLEARGYKIDPGQSGGFNKRNIAGTNTPSQHSFGNAVDINWTDNPRGAPGKIPADVARELAQKHGLTWGGDWRNPDPMHFEVARGNLPPVPIGQRGITTAAGMGSGQPPRAQVAQAQPAPQQQPAGAQQTPLAGYLSNMLQSPNPAVQRQGIALTQKLLPQVLQSPLKDEATRSEIDLRKAQTRYYDSRSEATGANADVKRLNAYSAMLQKFGGRPPSAQEWEQENQPGGVVYAAVGGIPIPFERAPYVLAKARNATDQFEPMEEERQAGITREMKLNAFRQQKLDELHGFKTEDRMKRGQRWNPQGSGLEMIPGGGTQSERNARTVARFGLQQIETAMKGLDDANQLQEMGGDTWTVPGVGWKVGGFGSAGQAFRAAEGAIMDLTFALSGKQSSKAEQERFIKLYMPSSMDSAATQKQKLNTVKKYFTESLRILEGGGSDDDLNAVFQNALREGERGGQGNRGPDVRSLSNDELLRQLQQ